MSQCARRILVVEDDEDIRESLREVLEAEGYTTCAAENGRAALDAMLHGEKPCVILLDLMMPVMNGAEFLGIIRRDPRLRNIPVIVVSAGLGAPAPAGTQGFLRKPLDLDTLFAALARHCPADIG